MEKKALGAILGFAFAGPFGAAAGVVLGHMADKKSRKGMVEDIQKKIDKALENEKDTSFTFNHLKNGFIGAGVDSESAERFAKELSRYLIEYVGKTKKIIEAVDQISKHLKLETYTEPILKVAHHYFMEEQDLIRDDFGGVLGLLDDAYLLQRLIERVSEKMKKGFGNPLLDSDLGSANNIVQKVLGMEVAGLLNQKVEATFLQAGSMTALNGIFVEINKVMPAWQQMQGGYSLNQEPGPATMQATQSMINAGLDPFN